MVHHPRQQLQGVRLITAVIKAVHHATQLVHLLQQARIGLVAVVGRFASALGVGVILQRVFQFVGDTDVVHHQPAGLVLEYPVYPGDGLHQIVTAHRLVHIHGMAGGGIETGKPHVTHDHQLQRVVDILETLFEELAGLFVVDVRLQLAPVGGGTGHYHLDRPLGRVTVVPLGAQGDDGVVHVDADLAAHGNDHPLAGHGSSACRKVGDQILGHLLDARRAADQLLQRRPLRLGLFADGDVLLLLEHLFHVVVQFVDLRLPDIELGEARFVIDRHRGTIVHRILNVVDGDIVAKHGAGVLVLGRDGRAGKANEGGPGQGIAQVFGIAKAVLAGFLIEGRLVAILAAVRLVAHYHDVVALAQYRMALLPGQQGELLDGGKDDPARLALGQHLAQLVAVTCLHRGLLQCIRREGEGIEELAVQVVAVGHHHDGRVVHLRLCRQFGGIADHGDRLARTLGVPHHPRLAGTGLYPIRIVRPHIGHVVLLRRRHRGTHRLAHRMKLMITGDLLDERVAILLKEDEVVEIVEQQLRLEEALHQGLQPELEQRLIVLMGHRAPGQKALLIGSEGTDPRRHPIAHHQRLVEDEEIRDLLLVGLQLLVGGPDIGPLVGRVLQLDHRQR